MATGAAPPSNAAIYSKSPDHIARQCASAGATTDSVSTIQGAIDTPHHVASVAALKQGGFCAIISWSARTDLIVVRPPDHRRIYMGGHVAAVGLQPDGAKIPRSTQAV